MFLEDEILVVDFSQAFSFRSKGEAKSMRCRAKGTAKKTSACKKFEDRPSGYERNKKAVIEMKP